MRLIDANALKKKICERYPHFIDRLALSEVFNAIKNAPSIDAVSVCRCNECKWWGEEVKSDGRRACDLLCIRFEPDFFCKYGERKEKKMNKLLLTLLWLFIIAVIGFGLYVLITYGGKPITEIPSWVVWFFIRK